MPETKDATSPTRKRDKIKQTLNRLLGRGSDESAKSPSAKDLTKDQRKDSETSDEKVETQRESEEERKRQAEADREAAKLASLQGEGLQGGVVGQPLHFVVVHPKGTKANYHFNVTGPKAPETQKKIQKDGNIAIDVTFSEKGTYKLHVHLGSHSSPIPGSPFKLNIHQDEEAMAKFQAEVAAAEAAAATAETAATAPSPPADPQPTAAEPVPSSPAAASDLEETKVSTHSSAALTQARTAVVDEPDLSPTKPALPSAASPAPPSLLLETVKAPPSLEGTEQATVQAPPANAQRSSPPPTASALEATVVAPR
eukprot:EG_transcript_13370